MKHPSFIHLHVHSQFSFLDGASTLDRLLERAVDFEMPALALTDHNRVTGAIRFYDKAKACGIKPIIGAEIDLSGGYHLTLLCKDRDGYSNLCQLLTDAHLSQGLGHPTVTRDMLAKYHAGLIALSGCGKGEVPLLIMEGRREDARQALYFYHDIFGSDYFIELTDYHSGRGKALIPCLADLARENGIPAVATNNVHYIDMEDYYLKELLNAISQNISIQQLSRGSAIDQYFRSSDEMVDLFGDLPGVIEMTNEVASRCNLDLQLGLLRFPKFDVPYGDTAYGYLCKLAFSGVTRKYHPVTREVASRLEMELATIDRLGFSGYFLIVWDIVRWARTRGIQCQARGSAVDSLVVYSLDISTVDPVQHDLLFERFMHYDRKEPPDIDLDIDRERRDEVRDYIYCKYGADNVSSISTISTYMARGLIRDVGKAMQMPREIIDEACAGIHYLTASELLRRANTLPELQDSTIYQKPELQSFFKLCAAIDGFPKYLSVHLGGLVIGDTKLSKLVPLEISTGGDIITQYNKDDLERLGLVKIDLLALPTITVIKETVSNIRENHGIVVDFDTIAEDDPETFDMLQHGKTIGVFQLESPAQREMAGRLLSRCFRDIIVSIALVRPGPLKCNMDKSYLLRRHGAEPVTYLHPRLGAALTETLGVIIYQEQVLKIAHDLAGFTYEEADGFRRAMTHDRTADEMEKMRDSFIARAGRNGVGHDIATQVFEQLAAFAAYGFCKAHAVAYADIAYKSLWLKRHYPAEFFAALLSNQPAGYYPSRVLVADARRFGVKVLPLDVNQSSGHYTVEGGDIRIGFIQLRGMTAAVASSIIGSRLNGKFASVDDFIRRVTISQSILENLIRAGAFDGIGDRKHMLAEARRLMSVKCEGDGYLESLIGAGETAPIVDSDTAGYESRTRMTGERELLSVDLSSHPLDFCNLADQFVRIGTLSSLDTGVTVKIIGSVIRYQTPPARNGNRVVYIILEDGTGVADVTVFSNVQKRCGQVLFRAGWLIIDGRIQRRGPKSLSIIAQNVQAFNFTL